MAPSAVHADPQFIPSELFPYETLSYGGRLEFFDRAGTVAVFKRRQKIRVQAKRLYVITDRIWGDGVVFGDYWTDGLDIVEFVRDRDSWVAVLGLPRVYFAGETFELRTERRIVGGFRGSVENWDAIMYAPARELTIEVAGAAARRIRKPMLSAPSVRDATVDRGADSLTLYVERPKMHSAYKLEWAW